MKVLPALKVSLLALLIMVGGAVSPARAQEVVINGGFDDDNDNFVGWTHSGDLNGFDSVGNNPLFSVSAPNHANLGSSPDLGSLSQTLNTVMGATYTLSFWLRNDGAANPNANPDPILNQFEVKWDGLTELSLVNAPVFNYTHYTFSVLATSTLTLLEFNYRNDADYFRLDSVSVTQAVPEPHTFLLGALGIGMLGLAQYRKSRRRL